jgi:hypothetical protein
MTPIVTDQPHRQPRRPMLRVLDRAERQQAPSVEEYVDRTEPRRAELQLIADGGREPSPRPAPMLLAGADARCRAILRAEFGATLPPRTRWVEADDIAQTLQRAAHSRMVILAGDLDDADADSLVHMLSRRHPELPVIRVDASREAVAGVCG